MRAFDHRRPVAVAAILISVVVTASTGTSIPAAGAASATITFHDPGPLTAGPVELRGLVSTGSPATTTVLYLVDVSQSTKNPSGLDCNADGVPGGPGDDQNGDGAVGDTFDCEIGAVKAVNAGLASSAAHSLVSLETFAGSASAVNLQPGASPPVNFVAPDATSAGGQNVMVTAVTALRRDPVPGTSYDPAVTTALNTLQSAPSGPKYIMMLTDGGGNASQSTIDALAASGVHLRSFAIANELGCRPSSDLLALAEASGESCYTVESPAELPPVAAAAQPPTVSAVQVTLGGRTFAATVDLAGGWRCCPGPPPARLPLTLGAGTWTATATALLSDGSRLETRRTFVVSPSASGPAPGTVSGPSPVATAVRVDRPRATVAALPRRVTGRVGKRAAGAVTSVDLLQNSTVLLRGRSVATRHWVTVGRALVGPTGRFTVDRRSKVAVNRLRVRLVPHGSYAGASASVPAPTISHCRFTRRTPGFTVRCRTVAPDGAAARLVRNGVSVDRGTVRRGEVRLSGDGLRHNHTLLVRSAAGSTYRLRL